MQQKIIILDFGSQTTQLIGRRVRELDTFCEIIPYNKFPADDPDVIGVILSGSPFSVYDPEAFHPDLSEMAVIPYWASVTVPNIWPNFMAERWNRPAAGSTGGPCSAISMRRIRCLKDLMPGRKSG